MTHESRPIPPCSKCNTPTLPDTPEARIEVAGIVYTGPVAGRVCPQCGHKPAPDLGGFRLRVARDIALNGGPKARRGEVFEFLREVLGYERKSLGELLDHTSEELLSWQMGVTPVPHAVMAVVGRLVLDRLDPEHATMLRLLRAAQHPDPACIQGKHFTV